MTGWFYAQVSVGYYLHVPESSRHYVAFNGILARLSCHKLDWPWIAEWAYAGIFAVVVRFQNQDQFWISHQKIRGHIFSEKSKNELVQPKLMFLAILAKIRSFSINSDM